MAAVVSDTSMSLDGLVIGPGPGPIDRRTPAGSGCTSGTHLFDRLGPEPVELEWTRAIEPPGITHSRLGSAP
jgi:hypothetical protein